MEKFNKQWSLERRFAYRIDEIGRPDGCWVWRFSTNGENYGIMVAGGRKYSAHRLSYETFVGPIADNMEIDHVCHTNDPSCIAGKDCLHRLCVNPDHLEQVSRDENVRRGHGHPWSRKTHCVRGHLFAEYARVDAKGHRHCRLCALARYHTYGKTTLALRRGSS